MLVYVLGVNSIVPAAALRKIDRQRLIAARVNGMKIETLLIAARPGTNAAVAQHVTELGASVRFREDSVDYLRVNAPVERLAEIAELPEVEVAAIDGPQMYYTTQDMPAKTRVQTAPPGANTPAENPFLPTQDIGAPQFIRNHPTFDGRGVTIANLDGDIPDILSPELQRATTLDGVSIQKITSVINSLDPIDDESPLKIDLANEVDAKGGVFAARASTYRVAADGRYRFGLFDTAPFGSLLRPYLNGGRSELAVLWDEQSNAVWIDTNQNQSFADETPLTDYNKSHKAGVLGRDDPATPERETVAFMILTDKEHKLVYLAPLVNKHTTATASVAAGNGFFGGRMNGVAPGAQIAAVLRRSVTHSLIEAMILSLMNPKIDLVSLQWSALMPPHDGSSIVGVTFQRLVEKYKKPIFASADNLGPGIATNTEAAAADGVISVGGYVSRQTWQSNFGIVAAQPDGVINLSARGPRADGGFKPDVVAPAVSASASFGASSQTFSPFALPPGYSSGSGTSIACPMVSGAAALLISAAKQTGVPYDAERIRWSLKSTARYLAGAAAHEQGSGLIDVAAAWEALKRAPAPVEIKSSAPINVGYYLPRHGAGIYEREGWQPGQSVQRTITFTRTSGKAKPVDYLLRWTGNDGAFASASTIRLPLNVPVSLPVTIEAKSAGVHSAILSLDEPQGARSVYQVMNTIVAADQFSERNEYTIRREGSAEYPYYTSYFFNVPPDTTAFKLETDIHEGTLRLRFMRPSGKELDQAHDVPVRWLPEYQTGGKLDRVITAPEPGVWQVVIENQSLSVPGELTSSAQRARFSLTASVFAAKAAAPLNQLSAARPNLEQLGFANAYAPFVGDYIATPLGSAFSRSISFTPGDEGIVYEVNVPAGANNLTATIAGGGSTQADVDLYLYFCERDQCELKGYGTRPGADERVAVTRPQAGKWKVVIDPFFVPAGTLTIDYTDVFTHPAFGSMTPETSAAVFAGDRTSSENFATHIDAVPTRNRRLVGLVQLMSREVATVGYEYDAATKRVEALKERVPLAESLIELQAEVNKPKPLIGSATSQ